MKNVVKPTKNKLTKTLQSGMRFLCLLFFVAGINGALYANPNSDASNSIAGVNQNIRVSGVVKDSNGDPLIGVSVQVKGTSTGTITNIDGKFDLMVSDAKSVLVVTYIGYEKQEIRVGDQRNFNITLNEDAEMLEEVVVVAVGFGSQKKQNLTGAITSVSAEALENRPVANIGQALQGAVPNLNISMSSGQPNAVPSFNIRGGTTMEYDSNEKKYVMRSGSPLILLDGVEISETQLNQLNPNDISDLSILKDASAAAIYGTRAAFGVILVQSKGGNFNQKAKISYSYDLSWDKPSALPDIMDSRTLLEAKINRGLWTTGTPANDTELKKLEYMQKYLDDPRPENAYFMEGDQIHWVATTNPYKEAFKDYTPTQKHNFSISGGTDRVSYYLSMGVQDQKGMYKIAEDHYRRYNTMMTVNAKVTNWFNVTGRITYNVTKYTNPQPAAGKGNIWSAVKNEPEKNINMPVLTGPNDPVPNTPTENVLGTIYAGRVNKSTSTTTIFSISPEFVIIPNELKIKGDFSFKPTTYRSQEIRPKQFRVKDSWTSLTNEHTAQNDADISKNSSDMYVINVYADFNKKFIGNHNVSAVLGVNQERYTETSMTAYIKKSLSNSLVNPTVVEDQMLNTIGTGAKEITARAVFGRVTYNYKERYLFGVDGRYDGSSKFTKNDRFQFFPTFSAGWRITEEEFMNSTRGWLDNLKIRGSWGRLGDQPGDAYPYQPVFEARGANYILEGKYPTSVYPGKLVSPLITWQKSTTVNLGLDIMAFQNRLDLSFDIYRRKVVDILTNGAAVFPSVLGADPPLENSGSLEGRGWELSIKWRDRLSNGLSYDVGLVLSDSYNKVLHYANNVEKKLGNLYDGQRVNEIWGYHTGGIMQEEDMYKVGNAWYFKGAYQNSKENNIYPGYIWYKDLNGDGLIDGGAGTVNDPGDRTVIGNSTPRYKFGFTANLEYKGFDLNLFFQGIGKRDLWISNGSYWGGNTGSWWMYNRSWTPERTDAKFPMYGSPVGSTPQTGYLINGAYLRMKQLVLGYTIPMQLSRKIGIDRLRFHVSGYNLFDITDIPSVFDPDQVSDAYPQKRTYAIGVQVTF